LQKTVIQPIPFDLSERTATKLTNKVLPKQVIVPQISEVFPEAQKKKVRTRRSKVVPQISEVFPEAQKKKVRTRRSKVVPQISEVFPEAEKKLVRMRRRRSNPPQKRKPGSRTTNTDGKRARDLAVLRRANFSIKKSGNRYTLSAKEVNDSVLEQIKSFLQRKTGKVYINERKLTKPAALRYISANLRKKPVEIVFRRR
jgi:hypothetical protein